MGLGGCALGVQMTEAGWVLRQWVGTESGALWGISTPTRSVAKLKLGWRSCRGSGAARDADTAIAYDW